MTIGKSQEENSDGSASPQCSPRPQRVKVRDPRWLQVQVCQDFLAKKCTRGELECSFAHPPVTCSVENGRVTACFDAMKGRCQRDSCKYFHPPKQIKDNLEAIGKSHQQQRVFPFQKEQLIQCSPMRVTKGPMPNVTLGHWMSRWHSAEQLQLDQHSPRSPNFPRRLDKSDKLEICSDFMNNICPHEEYMCPFAHPPPSIAPGSDGYVTVCMDYMKGECQRMTCRYFHPPPHLQTRVKAAQRRPSQVYGPLIPGNISPVMPPPPSLICSSPAPFPRQQLPVHMPIPGPGGMPPLVPVSQDIYFPVGRDGQCMVPLRYPSVPAYIWPTGEPIMLSMPPASEGFSHWPGQFVGHIIETVTPPATP